MSDTSGHGSTDDESDQHSSSSIQSGQKRRSSKLRQNVGLREPEALVYFTLDGQHYYGKLNDCVPNVEDRVFNKKIQAVYADKKTYPAIFLGMSNDHAELCVIEQKHNRELRKLEMSQNEDDDGKSDAAEVPNSTEPVLPAQKKKRGRPKQKPTDNDVNNIQLIVSAPSLGSTFVNPITSVSGSVREDNVGVPSTSQTVPTQSLINLGGPSTSQTFMTSSTVTSTQSAGLLLRTDSSSAPAGVPIQSPKSAVVPEVEEERQADHTQRFLRPTAPNNLPQDTVLLTDSALVHVRKAFRRSLCLNIKQYKAKIAVLEKMLVNVKSKFPGTNKCRLLEKQVENKKDFFPTKFCRVIFTEIFGESSLQFTGVGSTRNGIKYNQAPPEILEAVLLFVSDKICVPSKRIEEIFNEHNRDLRRKKKQAGKSGKRKRNTVNKTIVGSLLDVAIENDGPQMPLMPVPLSSYTVPINRNVQEPHSMPHDNLFGSTNQQVNSMGYNPPQQHIISPLYPTPVYQDVASGPVQLSTPPEYTVSTSSADVIFCF